MHVRVLTRSAVIAAIGLTLFGCGITSSTSNQQPPVVSGESAAPSAGTPMPSTAAPSSPPVAALAPLTPTGIDKYQVGAKLTTLKTAKLIKDEKATTGCPDWVVAKGVGGYADVGVIFFKGAVLWVTTDKNTYRTAVGISTGATCPRCVP